MMGAQHELIDLHRNAFPISATTIRMDAGANRLARAQRADLAPGRGGWCGINRQIDGLRGEGP